MQQVTDTDKRYSLEEYIKLDIKVASKARSIRIVLAKLLGR